MRGVNGLWRVCSFSTEHRKKTDIDLVFYFYTVQSHAKLWHKNFKVLLNLILHYTYGIRDHPHFCSIEEYIADKLQRCFQYQTDLSNNICTYKPLTGALGLPSLVRKALL